jgi:hypothetical protein
MDEPNRLEQARALGDVPDMVAAISWVELIGSALSILVALLFLMGEVERYIGSKQLAKVYGSTSNFWPYTIPDLAFIVFPMSIGAWV